MKEESERERERVKNCLTVLLSAYWTLWTLWGCWDETGISLCHSQCALTPAETFLPVNTHSTFKVSDEIWKH